MNNLIDREYRFYAYRIGNSNYYLSSDRDGGYLYIFQNGVPHTNLAFNLG